MPAKSPARPRIVVVDDDAEYVKYVGTALGAIYDVRTITRYAEARRVLSLGAFDLALIDYMLDTRDGIRLMRQTSALWPDRPLIVMTSLDDTTLDDRALAAGATDFFRKDEGEAVLMRRIQYALCRAEAARALRLKESQYQHLFQRSLAGLWHTDAAGEYLTINPAAARALGYEDREDLSNCGIRHILPGAEAASAFLEQVYRTGAVQNIELELLRKDGSRVPVLMSAAVVCDPAGLPISLDGTFIDLTERRQLEEQFLQSQKMEAIGRLSGTIAHDFNNLLTIIMGNVELAIGSLPEGSEKEDLRIALAAGKRARDLTQQLLAFSRKQPSVSQVVAFPQALEPLVAMLPRLLGDDIRVSMTCQPGAGCIAIAPNQLEQILLNVVVNARDAMPSGGDLRIAVRNVTVDEPHAQMRTGVAPGKYVEIAISDTGCGMSPEVKRHIFEPFFTTKRAGQGTGLGMSTVYGLVQQWGGHIWLYSEVGQGTTMRLCFPCVDVAARAPAPTGEARPSAAIRSATILLVDDEEQIRRLVEKTLSSQGYTVLAAEGPEEALRIAADFAGPIQLLLTDVVMPQLDGRQLSLRIRQLRPDTRVLFMSGYDPSVNSQHALPEADGRLLEKPFSMVALLDAVSGVIRPEGARLEPALADTAAGR
jgi:two-component system, cell cycle sensor histidine kinase and response regulator CckA